MTISRRDAIRALGVAAAATLGTPAILRRRFRLFAGSATQYSERAIRLVESTVVVDMLNQFRFADTARTPPLSVEWLERPETFDEAAWKEYQTSGIRVLGLGQAGSYAQAMGLITRWDRFVKLHATRFQPVMSSRSFEQLRTNGKVGIMITFQNPAHFRTIDDIGTFWANGQRACQLTYNTTNSIGSGFLATTDAGLTDYGAQVMARMHQVGMAVDLSHAGDRTTLDALAAAKKPVIVSHSACRSLVPGHLRAKTDEMIVKMAKLGGVMGIPLIGFLVKLEQPVTIEHVLDHYDHMVKTVGVEHVGMGGDLDIVGNANPVNSATGAQQIPTNQPNYDRYHLHADSAGKLTVPSLDHPKRVYDLTEGLIRRKYNDADISLMLGGNWQRVLASIWEG